MQNQNRSLKQELLQTSKTEEEKRKQLIEKFQGSLEGIAKQLGKSFSNEPLLKYIYKIYYIHWNRFIFSSHIFYACDALRKETFLLAVLKTTVKGKIN